MRIYHGKTWNVYMMTFLNKKSKKYAHILAEFQRVILKIPKRQESIRIGPD